MSDTAFLGHPIGLGWLSAAEFWERFSYYGMQALLVLYMTQYLLLPEHQGNVLGFAWFQKLLEAINGNALSGQALASATYGFYAGFVYVTPLAGSWLADRVLGRTATVTIGASLMAIGHFLMAFEVSFLFALLALLLGVGCFKGNIAAQVGELYRIGDPRRATAFQIYYLGIQIAVIISPLICGTLGQTVGWHWGFGAAGVGMVIGLVIYLLGRPSFPAERRRSWALPRWSPRRPVSRCRLSGRWRFTSSTISASPTYCRSVSRLIHGRRQKVTAAGSSPPTISICFSTTCLSVIWEACSAKCPAPISGSCTPG